MNGSQCPICREVHEAARTLVYDGFGVNSCSMYRTRIATLSQDARNTELGKIFAAAPRLVQVLQALVECQDYRQIQTHEMNNARAILQEIGA